MNEKIVNFMTNYSSPFFVGSLKTGKVLFVNKVAEKTFGFTKENCDFSKLFEKSEESIKDLISKIINPNSPAVIYNVTAISASGEKIFVDLHLGFFDDTQQEIFLEINPRGDLNLQSTMNFISHSTKAEALLNFDEEFTICHCNENFYNLFEIDDKHCIANYYHKMGNAFSLDKKELIQNEIHRQLKFSNRYITEVEIILINGTKKWIELDLQKRDINSLGDKILCVATNIDEKVKKDEKLNELNQYLTAMQEISDDILFRIDVKTKTLHCLTDAENNNLGKIIPNYTEVLMNENSIHPEDIEKFEKYSKDWYEDKINNCKLRFSVAPDCYEWYEVQAHKIYGENGELKEVFGKLVNIHEKEKLKETLETANKYLTVMQELTDDVLYRIDVKNMILYYTTKSETEEIKTHVVEDYINRTVSSETIHPDDAEEYIKTSNEWLTGNIKERNIRLKMRNNKYERYSDIGYTVLDKDGSITEIYGRLENIQDEVELNKDLDEVNKYLAIMQDLSDDVLFRIDASTMNLYHSLKSERLNQLGNPIVNYTQALIEEEILHPDDAKRYIEVLENWRTSDQVDDENPYRFALDGDEYKFYQIRNQPIFNENGELTEVFGRLVNVHEKEQLKLDFDELNDYFDIIQELSSDVVYKVDTKTMTLNHNIKSKHMLEKVGNNFPNYVDVFIEKEIMHPDDVEKWAKFVENRHNGIIEDIPFRFALMSEEYEWYLVKDKRIFDKKGELKELWGTLINVNREQELKGEYQELNQYYDVIQRLAEHIVYKVDVDTMTLHHNIKGTQVDKIGNDIPNYLEVLIKNEIIHPDDVEKYISFVQDRHDGIVEDTSFRFALTSEKYEWFKLRDERIYDKTGKLVQVWGTMINITRERELEIKATYDLMTQVLNKVSFETEVEKFLSSAKEESQHALIFIDLDDFKGVNDTLGHRFGDFLLTSVGKRLKRVIRDTDIVGRIGGDEFAVLLKNIANETTAVERAELLLEALRREFSFEGSSKVVKASLGVSLFPSHGTQYKELIQKSDMALYVSKRKGKDVATVFDETIEEY